MSFDVQQFANRRPYITIDRDCFKKDGFEQGQVYAAKKKFGKTKHHKFQTVLKVTF